MVDEETVAKVNELVAEAIVVLRRIRRLASKGGPVPDADHEELSWVLASLRHHTSKLGNE